MRAQYQRRLERELAAMQRDVSVTVRATYRDNPPEMATDASPARVLQAAMRTLGVKWLRRFDKLAVQLSAHFAKDAAKRSDSALAKMLRDAGFTVKFTTTAAMNDALQATIAENVSLIKSLPEQYLKTVEGDVMRSVQTGRDLGTLTKTLEASYGVSKRRAALIARDQNNRATATITRVRQTELGITRAKWLHSAGGKEPRPTHVAMSGKTYDIQKGWYDPDAGEVCWPGTLVNCRCVSVSIVPGFE